MGRKKGRWGFSKHLFFRTYGWSKTGQARSAGHLGIVYYNILYYCLWLQNTNYNLKQQ